jgi:DNA repair photolyase
LVHPRFRIHSQSVKGILSATSGFIAGAGFTHSLTPARNCTYACTYCYVPTMGIYGGLQPADWQHWGQFTTFKENAPRLLERALRPHMRIYCSPLVDPYQPAETQRPAMPALLDAVAQHPPAVFTIQTRGPAILRDLPLLEQLARHTTLRVSFSLTTDRDDIRRLYEPHCAPLDERLRAIRSLRAAGILVHATLAPILPCDPERLIDAALEATNLPIIGDPLHVRATKRHGATTRHAAWRIAEHRKHLPWFDPQFQQEIIERCKQRAMAAARPFAVGPEAFRWLAQTQLPSPDPMSPRSSHASASIV